MVPLLVALTTVVTHPCLDSCFSCFLIKKSRPLSGQSSVLESVSLHESLATLNKWSLSNDFIPDIVETQPIHTTEGVTQKTKHTGVGGRNGSCLLEWGDENGQIWLIGDDGVI